MRAIAIALVLLCPAQALAWDPHPYPLTFDEMVKGAECVIIGKVNSISVVSEAGEDVVASADVRIERCLKGECSNNGSMKVHFLAQTIRTVHVPVRMSAGYEMVFALKSKCSQVYKFDSEVWKAHKPDAAYACETFPGTILHKDDDTFSCIDAMFNEITTDLTYNHIKEILNIREK
jgi:hypothetical protein